MLWCKFFQLNICSFFCFFRIHFQIWNSVEEHAHLKCLFVAKLPHRNLPLKCAVVNYHLGGTQLCKLVGYSYLSFSFFSMPLLILGQPAKPSRYTGSDEIIMLLCVIGKAFRNSFLLFQEIFLISFPLATFLNLVFPQMCVYSELAQIAGQFLWSLWQSGEVLTMFTVMKFSEVMLLNHF